MVAGATTGCISACMSGEWAPVAAEVPGSSILGVLNRTLGFKREPPRVRTMFAVEAYWQNRAQCIEGTNRSDSALRAHRVDQGSGAVALGCEDGGGTGSGIQWERRHCWDRWLCSGGGGIMLKWRHRQSWA